MQMFLWTTLISVLMIQKSAGQMLIQPCGPVRPRIINGTNAEVEAASWMAAIRNNYQFMCGGTVIHKSFVLTAAHCIDGQKNLFVTVGTYNKSDPVQEFSVELGVTHKRFNNRSMINDIGLLKLSRDIVFNFKVYPICISMNLWMNRGQEVDAYGWGITQNKTESELLQKITLRRLHPNICNQVLYTPLTQNQICAGSRQRGDTCRGDSGGPLTRIFDPMEPPVQLAILSGGTIRCDGNGIYTDVSRYTDWIISNVNQYQTRFSSLPVPTPTQAMFLYHKCGGSDTSMNSLVKIYGGSFEGKGVLITDRYVLTNAKDLPSNAASLNVYLIEENFSDELKVESIIKHPDFSYDFNHDIALLKLTTSPFFSGGRKPICMLLQNTPIAARSPKFTTFDHKVFSAIPLIASDCATRINRELEQDQLCIEEPEMTRGYDYTGDILTKTVVYKGRNRYILFGIVSYSSNGLIILTNVVRYTDWISRIIGNA